MVPSLVELWEAGGRTGEVNVMDSDLHRYQYDGLILKGMEAGAAR